ncbi:hypothetical protein Scep_025696 [Stephania cephalantha]|uniref:Uncharacterized protein n=1 Tax=Stephania cephalantha TaxID=152367 RepID=A0AAP0HRE9_9MAGN
MANPAGGAATRKLAAVQRTVVARPGRRTRTPAARRWADAACLRWRRLELRGEEMRRGGGGRAVWTDRRDARSATWRRRCADQLRRDTTTPAKVTPKRDTGEVAMTPRGSAASWPRGDRGRRFDGTTDDATLSSVPSFFSSSRGLMWAKILTTPHVLDPSTSKGKGKEVLGDYL